MAAAASSDANDRDRRRHGQPSAGVGRREPEAPATGHGEPDRPPGRPPVRGRGAARGGARGGRDAQLPGDRRHPPPPRGGGHRPVRRDPRGRGGRVLDRAEALGVRVEVDMEDSSLVPDTLSLFRDAAARHPQTRLAIQAALRRTPLDLEALAPLKPRIRLVKGAYAEPVEAAQQGKKEIRAQFRYLTDWLFQHGSDPAFGTHDDELIAYVRQAAAQAGRGPEEFEFQFLYGIRRALQQQLVDQGHRVRVYIPFGSAWYPYLTRRMAERPANLLFFLRALVGR